MLAARAGPPEPGAAGPPEPPPASRAWFPGLLVNGPPAKSRRRLLVPVPLVPGRPLVPGCPLVPGPPASPGTPAGPGTVR